MGAPSPLLTLLSARWMLDGCLSCKRPQEQTRSHGDLSGQMVVLTFDNDDKNSNYRTELWGLRPFRLLESFLFSGRQAPCGAAVNDGGPPTISPDAAVASGFFWPLIAQPGLDVLHVINLYFL